MAELRKPKSFPYEGTDGAAKGIMDQMIDFVERRQTLVEAAQLFGIEAEKGLRRSVQAIQKFLEDPTSPEADQSVRDRLRDAYLEAADFMALTLGAGEELVRRYDAHYLENAAEELYAVTANGSDGDEEQRRIANLIACRDVLCQRMKELNKSEETHGFVRDAIGRLEAGRQLSVSISRGLPLEAPVSVRKTPLRLVRPMTP